MYHKPTGKACAGVAYNGHQARLKKRWNKRWGDEDLVSRVLRTSESMSEGMVWPLESFPRQRRGHVSFWRRSSLREGFGAWNFCVQKGSTRERREGSIGKGPGAIGHTEDAFQRAHREGLEERCGETRKSLKRTLEKIENKETTVSEVVKNMMVHEAKKFLQGMAMESPDKNLMMLTDSAHPFVVGYPFCRSHFRDAFYNSTAAFPH